MIKRDQKLAYPKRARDLGIEDRRKMLSELDWGRNLNDAALGRITERGDALDVRRRRFIYRAGDPADSLYAIIHGRVKLCRIEPQSDREAVIDILSEGSLFGESALYSTAGVREKLNGDGAKGASRRCGKPVRRK